MEIHTSNNQDEQRPLTPESATPSSSVPDGLGLHFWLAFWAIAITNLAAALDATTLSIALPTISESISGGQVEAFWAGTSYLLACTAAMLLWVSLSGCFGRRLIMVITLLIFAAGSVASAVADNYTVLIVGRTIQGIGGGGVIGLTTVLVTDLIPLRDRGRFYALISIIWAVGSTTGPIIGGALAQSGQWRWIFCWHTLLPLLLGVVGIICFALYEWYVSATPFIPVRIFLNYSTSIVYFGSFVHGLILYSLVYYMPEYFQAVQGYSALISGVAALPQTTTVVPCAMFVGIIVGKTGRYRWAVWAGWVLVTFGCGLLILLDVDTKVPSWIFLSSVSGLGIGLLFPSIALALQSSVPQAEVAMAATLVIFFRSFGQAVGVAVGASILDNRMRVELQSPDIASILPPDLQDIGAVALISRIKSLPDDSPLAIALKSALARSFRVIWATMCGLAGITMLMHIAIKEYDMEQDHVTKQRLVQEKKQNRIRRVSESPINSTQPI